MFVGYNPHLGVAADLKPQPTSKVSRQVPLTQLLEHLGHCAHLHRNPSEGGCSDLQLDIYNNNTHIMYVFSNKSTSKD